MRTVGTTLQINRGDIFTINREIYYIDRKPYMISSGWLNPFLLLIVSSNTYDLTGKWTKNYWLDANNYPKFDDMTPVYLPSISSSPRANNVLYYMLDEQGQRTYYWYDRAVMLYKPYSFTFSKTFLNSDTQEWEASEYQYQIRLVAGQLMFDYLFTTFQIVFPGETIPITNEQLYNRIYKVRPDLVAGLDYNYMLANFSENQVLLKPSIITVRANI